jgi:glycine cleavage system pyridoxal-binding protein P
MDETTAVLGWKDLKKVASDLIDQSLNIKYKVKVKVSEDLLNDENFYSLIVVFETIATNTLGKNIRDYINFGFICTREGAGANSDPEYRRMIIRLCIEFCAMNK